MKEKIIISLIVLGLILFFGGFLYSLFWMVQEEKIDDTQIYQECKTVTNDTEWCLKHFNPQRLK